MLTKCWTRTGTVEAYRDVLLRLCGVPLGAGAFGHVRVRDLTPGHCIALARTLRSDGFAPRTTAMTWRLLRALLDRAVRRHLLPVHPVDQDLLRNEIRPYLRVPKEDDVVRALDAEQARAFLAASAAHSRLHDLYVVRFLTGCRLGELLGLQLDDLQFRVVNGRRVRQLRITRSLQRGCTTTPVAGPTKTGATRWLDVGGDLAGVLDRILRERPALALRHGWRPVPNWVFVTRTGRPLDQSGVREDFARVLDHAGLEFSPHSMRHSFAALHILAGRNAKWVQQQLGHSKIGITLDLYARWFDLVDVEAAESLGTTLLGNTAGNSRPC